MAEKYKNYFPDPSEAPAIDVMPASNGEYVPPDPTPAQRKIMALQSEKIEEVRRKFGMSRRQFVRTAAAYSIGVWAVDKVTGGKWGSYAFAQNTKTTKACDLENPGAQLANLPGEFILDTQGHALDSSFNAKWRTQDPGLLPVPDAVDVVVDGRLPRLQRRRAPGYGRGRDRPDREPGPVPLLQGHLPRQLGDGEPAHRPAPPARRDQHHAGRVGRRDPRHGQQHDAVGARASSTPSRSPTVATRARARPLPTSRRTSSGWPRSPARSTSGAGSSTAAGATPGSVSSAARARPTTAGGSTTRTAWPSSSTSAGSRPRRTARRSSAPTRAWPSTARSTRRKFSPRDMGVIGAQYPDLTFFTYHSGYDGEHMTAYPGDDKVNSANRGVDCFIKSLRENGIDATRFVPPGLEHGNAPNMYAELGTTWWANMSDADRADAPARQAHQLRRSPPHRLGHRLHLVRQPAAADRAAAGACSSPTRPRSSTTCPTASTATGGIPGRTPSTPPATWSPTRTSPTGRSTPRPTPSGPSATGSSGGRRRGLRPRPRRQAQCAVV